MARSVSRCLASVLLLAAALLAAAHVAAAAGVVHLEVASSSVPATFWQRLSRLLGARLTPGTKLRVLSTAYAPSPYQTDNTPCITAAGTRVRRGTVAANFLPLGTILEINGQPFIVEDRMHPRYQRRLDIFFPSTSEALEFGRRLLEIRIVGYGSPGQPIRAPEPKPPAAKAKASPAARRPKTSPPAKQPVSAERATALQSIPALPEGITLDSPSTLDRARFAWYSVRQLMQFTAARRRNVNRFDVNCFTDEQTGKR